MTPMPIKCQGEEQKFSRLFSENTQKSTTILVSKLVNYQKETTLEMMQEALNSYLEVRHIQSGTG